MLKKFAITTMAVAFAVAAASPVSAATKKKAAAKSPAKMVKVEKKPEGGPIGAASCTLSSLGNVLFGAKKNCGGA